MTVHTFESTSKAYDSCMMGNTLEGSPVLTGDVLHIPSERVVGICDTWPISLTIHHGELHQLAKGYNLRTCPRLTTNVEVAKTLAKEQGYSIARYID